jgi:hypothetical protein
MNRARREFLERNKDPQIESYLFGQGHSCDIPDGVNIDCFRWYEYEQCSDKYQNKGIKGVMLLPDYKNQWSEDKIWLTSFEDAEFFVKWYNQNHNCNAVLIDADSV